MLQECVPPPHLGRSDELAAIHENLAAGGLSKAGRWTGGWADGRMGRSEHRIDAKRAQCSREPCVDLAVGLPKRTEDCNGCDDRVCDFVFVPHSLSTCRPANDRHVLELDRLISSH